MSLKQTLITAVLRGQLPKLTRHAVAILSGWLASLGFTGDANSTVAVVAFLLMGAGIWVVTNIWSAIAKQDPDPDVPVWIEDFLRDFAKAGARHLVAALGAFLAAREVGGDVGTVSGVLMAFGNWGLSAWKSPDKKPES